MHIVKKILSISTVVTLVIVPYVTFAQTTASTFSIKNPINISSVGGLVGKFVEIFSYIAIIVAVLAIVWVGFQFILAQGKPDRMNELKTQLVWIIIGIAVIIGARIMVDIVINTLGATGIVDNSIIQSVKSANSR